MVAGREVVIPTRLLPLEEEVGGFERTGRAERFRRKRRFERLFGGKAISTTFRRRGREEQKRGRTLREKRTLCPFSSAARRPGGEYFSSVF
jgi:hypothetical protein